MKVLQKTQKQQGNYFDRNNNKFNNNQGKPFNSLNEYRYDDVKSKRNDDSFMYINTNVLIDQLQQAKQRRKQVVWRLQVRKLQPKIHMRSQAAVILTQQLLSELAP
ncbi:Hypothetical_protein [Hexamita inflata]|uniref:Hypothetical_protein n=1 Tax=Hexamita inflata TaxID=28002 RepID=A0AA86R0G3_9EUKA|nr:Hypothetical protein HINF_LOCUS48127 [Hexamita inflata]CAI9960485.1 Hypothetical protein HINF_LOCUS48130 [Hexamita inflata]